MKKAILISIALLLASCAKAPPPENPAMEFKTERPLWWVLRNKAAGSTGLAYEDKWYRYSAVFEYIKPGEAIPKNAIYSQCPIELCKYRVVDRESGQVVRLESFGQWPCENCHRR